MDFGKKQPAVWKVNKEVGLEDHESGWIGRSIVVFLFEEYPISNAPLYASKLGEDQGCSLPSTKEMTLPAGPPILRRAPAALEIAGPAEAETLDRPSEALEAAEEAVSLALEAASEVDEACLTAVLRVRNCDCRRTARVAAGILVFWRK
jgi:hypothetical protein